MCSPRFVRRGACASLALLLLAIGASGTRPRASEAYGNLRGSKAATHELDVSAHELLQRCKADAACASALSALHGSGTARLGLAGTDAGAASGVEAKRLEVEVKGLEAAAAVLDGSDGPASRLGAGSEAHAELLDSALLLVVAADDQTTSLELKAVAALVLFLEAVAGMYLPLALRRLPHHQWWLSLLNCFSGGIFLAAGIVHLLPHCAEAQEALGPLPPPWLPRWLRPLLPPDYPLYLVLVVWGYCLVFWVERVLFDVHGEGHSHCQHSNVFSHSSYYKQLSHRQRAPPGGGAGSPGSRFAPRLLAITLHGGINGVSAVTGGAPAAGAAGGLPVGGGGSPEGGSPDGCSPCAGGSGGGGGEATGGVEGSTHGGAATGLGSAADDEQTPRRPQLRAKYGGVPLPPPAPPPQQQLPYNPAAATIPTPSVGCCNHHNHNNHNHNGQSGHNGHGHDGGVMGNGHAHGHSGASLSRSAPTPLLPAPPGPPPQQLQLQPGVPPLPAPIATIAELHEVVAAAAASGNTGGVAAGGAGGGDEDASSCHSEHSPRAVCICVEEVENAQVAPSSSAAALQSVGHAWSRHEPHGDGRGRHSRRGSMGGGGGSLGGTPRGLSRAGSASGLRSPLLPPPSLPLQAAGGGGLGGGGGDPRLAMLLLLQNQHRHSAAAAPGCGQPCGHDHAHTDPQRPRSRRHSLDPNYSHSHSHGHGQGCGHAHDYGCGDNPNHGGHQGHSHHHCCHLDHDSHGSHASQGRPQQHSQQQLMRNGSGTQSHGHGHHGHHGHGHGHAHGIRPRFRFMHGVVLLVALALHTMLECIALGLVSSRPQFLVLFAAVASHKAVSALALSSRFLKEGASLGQVTRYVGPFCLVAPASILLGVYVGAVAPALSLLFSCFATGTFIYVGASEVIMEEFEGEMRADRRDISTHTARYAKFGAVLVAVAAVAASGLLPEHHH
eukprot:XP_001693529.1 ZIP family transporter [Chlamydomonas reinhardtii]